MYATRLINEKNMESFYPYKEVQFEGSFIDADGSEAYAKWYRFEDDEMAMINFLQINKSEESWEAMLIDAATLSVGDIVYLNSEGVRKDGKLEKENEYSSLWVGVDEYGKELIAHAENRLQAVLESSEAA